MNMLGRLDAAVIKATKTLVKNGADKRQNIAEGLKNERQVFAQVRADSQQCKAQPKNIRQ